MDRSRVEPAGAARCIAFVATARWAALLVFAGAVAGTAAGAAPPSHDPYVASLRYAQCMRAHGVPHPLPDKHGDFSLTAADEKRMRAVPERIRKAADDACFHHLEGLNLKPLSKHALALATKVVADLGRCIHDAGFATGRPQVRNLGRGRASFGFTTLPNEDRAYWNSATGRQNLRAMHACEQRVHLAKRLSKIIADDRRIRGNV
jgi:hypothetical protein